MSPACYITILRLSCCLAWTRKTDRGPCDIKLAAAKWTAHSITSSALRSDVPDRPTHMQNASYLITCRELELVTVSGFPLSILSTMEDRVRAVIWHFHEYLKTIQVTSVLQLQQLPAWVDLQRSLAL